LVILKTKREWCLNGLCVALSAALLCGLALAQTKPGLAANASYDAIIASARAGAHAQAIEALRAWRVSNPQDQRVASDLVVVMGWAGQDADALASAKASGSAALAPYALRSAAKSARNQQDHAWALEAYSKLYAQDAKDCDALLGVANSQVDLRQSQAAHSALTQLETSCVNAQGWPERLAQTRSYWAARQKNSAEPRDLVALAWWSDQMASPQSGAAYPVAYRNARVREAVLVASRTGSHQLARTWLAQAEPDMSTQERASVLAAMAGQQIRWAINSSNEERAKWRELLTSALAQLSQAEQLTKDPQLLRSITSDRMAAYAEQGDDAQTLRIVREADSQGMQLLPHAELAASDALMRQNQPKLAEQRLRRVLTQLQTSNEFDKRELNIALFYALLDQGKVSQARALIEGAAVQVPLVSNKGMPGIETPDDAYIRFQLARAVVASSSQNLGEQNHSRALIAGLRTEAPFNTTIRLDEAETLQSYGKFNAAATAVELVRIDHPDNTRALEMAARHALDRNSFAEYESSRYALVQLDAHPIVLNRLQTNAQRQMGFALSGDITRGLGSSANSSNGSSDTEGGMALLSPVFNDRWRIKARWRTNQAQFTGGEAKSEFGALGLRFYWPSLWAEAELTQRATPSAPVGVRVTSSWRVVDGLSFNAAAATQSEDLPVRGQAAGVSAKSLQLAFDWRLLPQTYLGLSAGNVKSTDGNNRADLNVYADQSYSFGDSFRGNLRLDAGRSTNSQQDVAYYSPVQTNAYAITSGLSQALMTAGQLGWTHKLTLSLGQIAQLGYPTGASYSIGYEHELRLGTGRTVSAAIGQSRRPYDGVQDRRRTLSLRWNLAL
jgi:biofilm PGA synthesis protein PgaA